MNQDTIEQLKAKLSEFQKIDGQLKLAEADFQKTQEGQKQLRDSLKSEVEDLKKNISDEVLQEFSETKVKSFSDGIGVQERKELVYDDKKAFDFALDKKMFLSLDKKSFEKVATSLGLDFVQETIKLLVTFPKELK